MELTPDQIRAVEAAGRVVLPATEEQVARLTMQRRIFMLGGRPHVVRQREGGFLETHATLGPVLTAPSQDPPLTPSLGTVQDAMAEDASTLEIATEARSARGGAKVIRRGRGRPPRGG